MVDLVKKTEKSYRAIELDSYSSLALFLKDRKQYYKKYMVGEFVEDEEDNKAILMGTLVETLLLEGQEEFDNKFYMSITQKDPTPNKMKFIHALYRKTLESVDEDGTVGKPILILAEEAYIEVGIKKPGFEGFMKEFIGSEDELYYKQLRDTKPMNKSIVSMQDIDNANKIINEIRANPVTSFIFNQVTDSRYTVFNQLQVQGYTIDGLELKSMYDKIIGDHQKKTIQFYDLKCTWKVEGFYEEYYLYRYSYIQAYLYWFALSRRLVDLGFDYSDYTILYPIFVVVDSINYMKPLLFKVDEQDINDALKGFKWKNRYYPGVQEIIEELKWAKDNNEWRISKYASDLGGILPLKRER
jgi:hypothetical protein